jgi:hypothetical protein
MNTSTKLGLSAALVGLVIWGAYEAKKAYSNFAIKVKSYGFPNFSNNYTVILPITLSLYNPTPFAINIDRIEAQVSVLKGGAFIPVAYMSESGVSLPSGSSTKVINPVLQLANLVGGNIKTDLMNIYKDGKLIIRTQVTMDYGRLRLTPSPVDNEITIPKLPV